VTIDQEMPELWSKIKWHIFTAHGVYLLHYCTCTVSYVVH